MEGPKVNMQNLKRWKDKQLQTSTSKHQGLATPMEEWVWTVFFSQGCGRVLKSDAKLLRGFGILVVLKTGFSISTNILAGNWVTINLEIPGARAFFGCREGMIVWRWNPHRPYLVKPWNIAAFQGPPIMGPLIHTIPIPLQSRIPKALKIREWQGNSKGPAYQKEVPCPWVRDPGFFSLNLIHFWMVILRSLTYGEHAPSRSWQGVTSMAFTTKWVENWGHLHSIYNW